MKDSPIYVTKSSMPLYEEYINMIKPLWETHKLTNNGEYHKILEQELTCYLNVDNICLMTNGHMAIELVLQALELKGEVITTPFTFVSTTHAIVRNGLTPVFCDINKDNYTIDADKIEQLITDKTSAILPVHVYGQICDVDKIQNIANKYHLKVIYDAAHAFGVRYKGKNITQYGDASVLSFHATKVFNTVEGGAVIYHNENIGKVLYGLKNFGIRDETTIDLPGANAKMDELRAIMGICNLRHIDEEIVKREKVYLKYQDCLSGIDGIELIPKQKDVESNYGYFPIMINEKKYGKTRDELYEYMKTNNIFTRKYFYPLTSDAECYNSVFNSKNTPIAKYVSERILCIPIFADLEVKDIDRICGYIKRFSRNERKFEI